MRNGWGAGCAVGRTVGFVACSPFGRGFLTGHIRATDDLAEDDYRRHDPCGGADLARDLGLADRVRGMADEEGCTPAQLALAWVLAQGEDIVPIPGTRRRDRLEDNLGALDVDLSTEDLRGSTSWCPSARRRVTAAAAASFTLECVEPAGEC